LTIPTSEPFGQLLQQAYRAADAAITRGVRRRGFDVRASHSAVLAHIDIATGTRATVLAERAGVSKQAIGEVVDDLVKKGFVRRAPDPADARAKLVQLTPRGKELIDAAYEVIAGMENALVAAAGPRNVAAARKTLAALVEVGAEL
jgi:DNA-binding MarR family transcriptional regulator